MTGVKILDKNPGAPRRRSSLWEALGRAGVNPTEIKGANGAYYAIVPAGTVEKVICDETKQILQQAGFTVLVPIEYNSLRTIVIKHIDIVIMEYTDQEIIDSINTRNAWAEAESIYKLTGDGRLMKVQFKTTEMVKKALDDGLVVLNQRIPPRQVEREIYVKLVPCYNCFDYTHKTRECNQPNKVICTYCAQEGHKQINCNALTPKCINCDGQHRTLAAACPTRKTLIKQKSKEIRDRSRSRSQARQQTYAQAAGSQQQQQQQQQQNINFSSIRVDAKQSKQLIAKITVAIVYAQCQEAHNPGTFQQVMDDMLALNGLPRVQFPLQTVTDEFRKLVREVIEGTGRQTDTDDDTNDDEEDMDDDQTGPDAGAAAGAAAGPSGLAAAGAAGAAAAEKRTTTPDEKSQRKKQKQTESKDDSTKPKKPPKPTPTQTQTMTTSVTLAPAPLPTRVTSMRRQSVRDEDILSTQSDKIHTATYTTVPTVTTVPQAAPVGGPPPLPKGLYLKIFIRPTYKHLIECDTKDKQERLRRLILAGQAKFHWRDEDVAYEHIVNAIMTGQLEFEKHMFKICDEKEFSRMTNLNLALGPEHGTRQTFSY